MATCECSPLLTPRSPRAIRIEGPDALLLARLPGIKGSSSKRAQQLVSMATAYQFSGSVAPHWFRFSFEEVNQLASDLPAGHGAELLRQKLRSPR